MKCSSSSPAVWRVCSDEYLFGNLHSSISILNPGRDTGLASRRFLGRRSVPNGSGSIADFESNLNHSLVGLAQELPGFINRKTHEKL